MFRNVNVGTVGCLEIGLDFGGGVKREGRGALLVVEVVVIVGFLLAHGLCLVGFGRCFSEPGHYFPRHFLILATRL
jgi:hypothetical protein